MQNKQPTASSKLGTRLTRYIAPYWDALMLALIGMIVMAATVPMLAALIQPMFDSVMVDKNQELVQLILLGIIALYAVRGVAGHISTYTINWVGSKLMMDLRDEMFDKLLMLPSSYHSSQSDRHISRITSDTIGVARAFVDVITVMVKDTLTILGLVVWIFYVNWTLALLALMTISVILLITQLVTERMREMGLEAGQNTDGLAQVLKGAVQNLTIVKLHSGERYESQRVREQVKATHRFFMRRIAIASVYIPLIQIAVAIALSIIIYVAAQQTAADEFTAGGLASLIAALLMLFAPVKRMAGVQEILNSGLVAAQSVFSLLDVDAELDTGTIDIERARGELRFEEVSYCRDWERRFEVDPAAHSNVHAEPGEQRFKAYPGLRDITLTIRPGETVALMGHPGSIAAITGMVPRFINPSRGKILLDGHDLRSLTLASLRANIALVSPRIPLLSDTIAANIAYGGAARATEAQITAAAQAAHASEFIRKMPQGLQTRVGEGGEKLTCGQRLRIVIARVLLKNPPILILDETFHTKDPESAYHVQAALDAVMQGRTTLVIANRLSTVEKADVVVLLDKGRVLESGRHEELLARDGAYTGLVKILFLSKTRLKAKPFSSF